VIFAAASVKALIGLSCLGVVTWLAVTAATQTTALIARKLFQRFDGLASWTPSMPFGNNPTGFDGSTLRSSLLLSVPSITKCKTRLAVVAPTVGTARIERKIVQRLHLLTVGALLNWSKLVH
jgi:hypothetical protein